MTVFNPDIPPELEQVVMWALNKNPVDRPANADQFITALEQARTVDPIRRARAAHREHGGAGRRGRRTLCRGGGREASGVAAAAPPARDRTVRRLGHGIGAARGRRATPPAPRCGRGSCALLVLLLAGGGVAAYLILRPEKVVVPGVVNEDLNTARTQLQNAGFTVGSPIQVTGTQKAGTVIAQDPQAGTKAKEGSSVSLTVSSGPGTSRSPPWWARRRPRPSRRSRWPASPWARWCTNRTPSSPPAA